MWKKFIINMALEQVFDALIEALDIIARKSSSKVDDKMVSALRAERGLIITEIKRKL